MYISYGFLLQVSMTQLSIESAKACGERMKNDKDFRKEVGEKSFPEDRKKFVKESGFDFSSNNV